MRARGLDIPGSHLPLPVVGSVTLGGRDSAPLYSPLKMDKLGQAGHWVAWHRVLPVRGTPVTQTRLPFSPGEYHGASSDCQSELRETFYSATFPAPSEAPRNLTSVSPASCFLLISKPSLSLPLPFPFPTSFSSPSSLFPSSLTFPSLAFPFPHFLLGAEDQTRALVNALSLNYTTSPGYTTTSSPSCCLGQNLTI